MRHCTTDPVVRLGHGDRWRNLAEASLAARQRESAWQPRHRAARPDIDGPAPNAALTSLPARAPHPISDVAQR